MRVYLAQTILGARGVRKERAKPFPTAPTQKSEASILIELTIDSARNWWLNHL